MESALLEAEKDYQNGRFVSHSSICERYGILDESVDKTKTIIVDVNGNEIVFRN